MDIVEELNLRVPQMPMVSERRDAYAPWRAADEITRLRAENERLRKALKAIQNAPNHARLDHFELVDWMSCAARAALQEKQDG